MVVQRQRRKHHRHRAGSRHRPRHAQIRQIQTKLVKIFLRKINALPRSHIRGADYRKRSFAVFIQIAKRHVAKQRILKLLLQQIAAPVFRRSQARHVHKRQRLLKHQPLEILL